MNPKLEAITIPVGNVDRAKEFYKSLDFREDADISDGDMRLVQLTPPGSAAAIFIGHNITDAQPGSAKGMVLAVDDVVKTHQELSEKGIEAEEIFHGPGGLLFFKDKNRVEPGIDPNRESYRSFTAFTDPDGNGWIVQEISERLPGR